MRRNGILIALACMTFLAGIGAAVDLFGGNEVQYSSGSGGAAGGPYVTASAGSSELGVKAYAWANDGSVGAGSAAFNGSGSASAFNSSVVGGSRGFKQTVYYDGRVQAKVDKTSSVGTASASALVYAKTTVTNSTANGASVFGEANITTSIGRTGSDGTTANFKAFNGSGTAKAVASGMAGYSAEYINKSNSYGRNTSVKTEGKVSGETYLTAYNKNALGLTLSANNTKGSATINTESMASEKVGSSSDTDMHIDVATKNGKDKTQSTIDGFAKATEAYSRAWDTNRTSINPVSTNYNVFSQGTGNLSASLKAHMMNDEVAAVAETNSEASHTIAGAAQASSGMYTRVTGKKLGAYNNTTYRAEASAFVDTAALQSIVKTTKVAAESNIKTGTGIDNVGSGLYLSNRTSNHGLNVTTDYSQSAIWDITNKRFNLQTNFKVESYGINYTPNVGDQGAIGARMNIERTGKNLNATKQVGTTTTTYSTDIPNQQVWQWAAANTGTLNKGGKLFSTPSYVPSGQETTNTDTYSNRHYTREFDTSNPF